MAARDDTPTDARPGIVPVLALFGEEITAQEAIGLLVHDGFSPEEIHLLPGGRSSPY